MKKYLFIVPSLSKGGAEKVVSILSNNLIRKGRMVSIITHFKTDCDYYVDEKVKIICLSEMKENQYREKMSLFYLLKLLKKLRVKIIEEKADYIIPFLVTTCIRTEIALAFSKEKNKIIHTVRNNPKVFPKNKILRLIRNYLINNSKITIVQNNSQKDYFNKKNWDKIHVLYNPVENKMQSIELKQSDKIIKIIGVGRLEPQKNFKLLINSFSNIAHKYPNTQLEIYGEGSLKKELNDYIENKELNNRIKLMGRSNDYQKIYGDADIFVLSSIAEGMPNALLEAMSVGLASISTDCPTGPSDIIDNYKDGILISNNNIEEMTKALSELIENNELRKKIGKNAKEKVHKEFSEEKICEKLIEICE